MTNSVKMKGWCRVHFIIIQAKQNQGKQLRLVMNVLLPQFLVFSRLLSTFAFCSYSAVISSFKQQILCPIISSLTAYKLQTIHAREKKSAWKSIDGTELERRGSQRSPMWTSMESTTKSFSSLGLDALILKRVGLGCSGRQNSWSYHIFAYLVNKQIDWLCSGYFFQGF